MQHYWCVNCGYSHDYGKDKKRGVGVCHNCAYEDVLELEEDEWDVDSVKLHNQHVLKNSKITIEEPKKVSDEQLQQWLADIKAGKRVVCI